jgi:hypothetical protein
LLVKLIFCDLYLCILWYFHIFSQHFLYNLSNDLHIIIEINFHFSHFIFGFFIIPASDAPPIFVSSHTAVRIYFFCFHFLNALAAFRNYTFPIPLIFSCVFLFYFDCGPFRREYFTFRSRMQSEHVFRPTTNGKSCHHPKNLITTPPKNNATSPRYIRRC